MRTKYFWFLSLICTSCGIYQSEWDCPPAKGVRCKAVSEVLDMIVEKEQSEDLFIPDSYEASSIREEICKKRKPIRFESIQFNQENKTLYLLKNPSGEAVIVEAKAQ